MKRSIQFIACSMAMLMLLTSCGSPDSSGGSNNGANASGAPQADSNDPSEPAAGSVKTEDFDTLVYGMNTEPARLDPQNDNLLNTMFVNKQIYNTLVVIDDLTGEITPSLATEWEWIDDTTLHMTLREDVTFHNGDKFTAEDVIFTIQRYASGSASASLFASFDGENSKVLDEYAVEIKLKEPYGPALNMLASMKGAIVSKNYCETVDENTFQREPIGTGPFKFVNWVSGDRITLVRNEEYWGTKPSYANLVMRTITDVTARAIELETGGVDIIDTLNGSDVLRFRDGQTEGVNIYEIPGYKIHYLVFNEDHPILSNEKVRLAIAHAIEIGPIGEAGFGITAVPATSSMATTIFGYKPTGPYEYDVEKAKELLAEAGYADGFACEMVVPDLSSNIKMAESIQAYLSKIGIDMSIQSYDAATWQSMCRDGSAKFSIQNLTADSGDPDHSYMNLYADASTQTVRTSDETVNRLLKEGRAELDQEKRKEIYAEIQDYIFEKAIWVPIDEPIINFATRDYILDFVPNAGVQPDLTRITINH